MCLVPWGTPFDLGCVEDRSPCSRLHDSKMSLTKQTTGKGRKVKVRDGKAEGLPLDPESMEESIRVCTRMRPLFPKEVSTEEFGTQSI